MINPFESIIKLLESQNVPYRVIEHKAVFTSEDAACVRGLSVSEGAKSLLLKTDDHFVLIVMPGDRRLDSKKLKNVLGSKKLRFATPEEVREIMSCEIGACYPFGNILGLRTLVDTSFVMSEFICASPGKHTASVRLKWADYQRVVKPEMVVVTMEEKA